MSQTLQMRTTQEQSGEYQVFATAEVGGDQPVKGLAIHQDIVGQLEDPEYVEVEISEDGDVSLVPDKATSATVRADSGDSPAVRHAYLSPEFLRQFDEEFEFEGEETDLDTVPDIGLSSITSSTEDAYESEKEERSSVDENAVAALVGDEESADETEGEAEEDDEDEEVEVSNEEIGIAE